MFMSTRAWFRFDRPVAFSSCWSTTCPVLIMGQNPETGVPSIICLSELELAKQRGDLRKACSKFGNAVQPRRRVNTTSRLLGLRNLMASEVQLGTLPIQAYLVTSHDEHQSTDVEDYEKRREYISGFSGSYGNVIVTKNKAALWTDARYHLQADEQIDCNWLLFREGHKHIPKISDWLKKELPQGGRIGLNPKLVSEYMWNKLRHELSGTTLELVGLNVSLIDIIWTEGRSPKRSKDAFILGVEYAGKNYTTKVNETRRELSKLGADAMVVTSLDEIAWLLNIRGRDVPYSPFFRSYVILDMNNVFLYVNSSQLHNRSVLETLHSESKILQTDSVRLRDYSDIWRDLRINAQRYVKILVPAHCVHSEGASHAIYKHIFEERRLPRQSPIIFLKSVKNSVEIRRMQEANIIDAARVCDCYAYLEKCIRAGDEITERDVVRDLNDFIFEQKNSLGHSSRTLVAYGSNSAYHNYEPTPNTDTKIFPNSTIILDSGGQYYGGTTKVTRTLHFGTPTDDMKEAYTRVLIGLIQLSTLTFPSNTKMAVADVVARAALWEVGLDYPHDTGSGIGAFLGVHESPIKLHFDSETSMQEVFKPGYFLSSEPGFYQEAEFGIRLENVLEVIEKPWLERGGQKFLGFKVVTLVPFEINLIKLDLMTPQQKKWLNNYNEQVRQLVGGELKKQKRMDGFYWMMEKTKYIPENGQNSLANCQSLITPIIMIIIINLTM